MKEPCGCRANAREWLAMCQPHADEFAERHLRAQKEKTRAELVGRVSVGETPDQPKPE